MSRNKILLFLLALATQVGPASAAVTYAVGTCRPGLPSFGTISAALTAAPAPNVVEVCAGTYPEQVVITKSVTLEGISASGSAEAIIAVPTTGLVTNATDTWGDSLAVQLWVDNATGPVTLSNLVVDGTGGNSDACRGQGYLVGVFYRNSPGTVNKVTTRNQSQTGVGCGVGIWLEGGSANPSVTLQNSTVHDFDYSGIIAATNSTTSVLTDTIKGNDVDNAVASDLAIYLGEGSTHSVSGNFVVSNGNPAFANNGIGVAGGAGSVSDNTIINNAVGIGIDADGVSVTSNKILNGTAEGIQIGAASAPITGNTVIGAPVGIDFTCTITSTVHSNTIIDALTGITNVPPGTVSANTYNNVGTIRQGGC